MDSKLVEILQKQFNFEIPEAEAFLALSEASPKPEKAATPAEIKDCTGFRGDIPELLDFASNEGYVAKWGQTYSLTDSGRSLIDGLRDDNSEDL